MARDRVHPEASPTYPRSMGGTSTLSRGRPRPRGSIDTLPSGSLRVRVYAGVDILTKRELYLSKIIPAGPNAGHEAEDVRDKFIRQVVENRQPKTNASLSHLIDKHIDTADLEPKGRATYRGYARKHIKPLLGSLTISAPTAEHFDSFYAELRRCRDHCQAGRPTVKHYTQREHKCTARCKPHVCKPLSKGTIRKIHFIISGAYARAIRWEWISTNPVAKADKPAQPAPAPQPPSAEEAAAIVNEAWRWGFGAYVWLAMTTGARRGEMCALRWRNLRVRHARAGGHDCIAAACEWTLDIRRAIGQDGKNQWESDTKTHQIRMIALDVQTVAILTELHDRAERVARLLGIELTDDAFIFASSPDGLTPLAPESVSKKFARTVKRLRIDTALKSLRHYSATELIAAGVDIRTVAGRLGHSGGGTTTLKVYAAFVAARDQHASTVLMNRMPTPPPAPLDPNDRALVDPQTPFETVAAEVFCAVLDGTYPVGSQLPSVKEIALAHGVSVGTAHRAMTLLKDKNVVAATSGKRAIVLSIDHDDPTVVALKRHQGVGTGQADDAVDPTSSVQQVRVDTAANPSAENVAIALELDVLHMDVSVRQLWTEADPANFVQLRRLLENAVKRRDGDLSRIGEYELAIRRAGEPQVIRTLVVAA